MADRGPNCGGGHRDGCAYCQDKMIAVGCPTHGQLARGRELVRLRRSRVRFPTAINAEAP